jgi:hypothetical protein
MDNMSKTEKEYLGEISHPESGKCYKVLEISAKGEMYLEGEFLAFWTMIRSAIRSGYQLSWADDGFRNRWRKEQSALENESLKEIPVATEPEEKMS